MRAKTLFQPNGAATALTLILLAGCAQKPAIRPAGVAERPTTAPRPTPPGGLADSMKLPERDGQGGYRTVNSGLSDAEAMWHLRSALNVAALSCDRSGKLGLAGQYNRMLGQQRKALATAYRAEGSRHGSAAATDAHVTQVYNFFAQPAAQARFCAAASQVAAEAAALPADALPGFAPKGLARLTAPFDAYYDDVARYRVALAEWQKGERSAPPAAARTLVAAAAPAASSDGQPWRIQLGAYSGDRAARDAWGRIRQRMKGAADFEPRYEAVPKSALVRVRIGPVNDRGTAIALCAAAAGAGLDCLPVPPRA